MTAITAFDRLESLGRYTDGMDHDDLEVVVNLGNVSLVLSKLSGEHLAHWSLPAVDVTETSATTMLLRAHDGAPETVVIDDPTMVDAIRQLKGALTQRRKKPWGLRFGLASSASLLALGVMIFVVPQWMANRAASIPPPVRQVEISQEILKDLELQIGPMCQSREGQVALDTLVARVLPDDPPMVYVFRNLAKPTINLPGNVILLSHSLTLTVDDPASVAGYLLAAHVDALTHDPMADFVNAAGIGASFSILTTGKVRDMDVAKIAQTIEASPQNPTNTRLLLTAFELADVSTAAYAQTLPTTPLRDQIEKGDPFPNGSPIEILNDGLWLGLQDICAE